MNRYRVAVTGVGAVSPFGHTAEELWKGLYENRCAIRRRPDAADPSETLAALVPPLRERAIPRHFRRCMSPMSEYACLAAAQALRMAGPVPKDSLGVCFASTVGSLEEFGEIFRVYHTDKNQDSVKATAFFKIMGHSVASNVVQYLGLGGRQIAPSAACASGLMSIGLAWEAVATGRARAMLCGGADEYHPLTAAMFAKWGALSREREENRASLPFDARRSGLVCGEGAGAVLLERVEDAQARNAGILAEITGFSCCSSPGSVAFPEGDAIENVMRKALDDAGLEVRALGCINAHATATLAGDEAEGQAIARLLRNIPTETGPAVQSFKGHIGHTMAASGALELIACIAMLRHGLALPTCGLLCPDPSCLTPYLLRQRQPLQRLCILKNSFAMGGVYTSIALQSFA